jgi:hypothetical protein
VLRARGFSGTWRRWIATLLSTASSRILLNGCQGEPIQHRRGVHQGDSLSPLLFIFAMDVLHKLFIKASEDGVLRPMQPAEIKYNAASMPMMSYFSSGQHVTKPRQSEQSWRSLGRLRDCTQTSPNAQSRQSSAGRTRYRTSSTSWAAKCRNSQSVT